MPEFQIYRRTQDRDTPGSTIKEGAVTFSVNPSDFVGIPSDAEVFVLVRGGVPASTAASMVSTVVSTLAAL